MRVSMSAMGSAHAHMRTLSLLRYQLALIDAGDFALIARSRSLLRPRPNLLIHAARAAGQRAAVAHAGRIGVARQRLQLEARRRSSLVRRPCASSHDRDCSAARFALNFFDELACASRCG